MAPFQSRHAKLWPIVVTLPALLLFGVFVLLPALGNFYFSFTDFNGNIHVPHRWVGLQNYMQALSSDFRNIGEAVQNTFIFSILVTLGQNALAVLLAVLVNIKLRGRNIYRSVLFIPSVLGVVVIGLIWTLMFDPFSGPVHALLQSMGFDSPLLGSPNAALYLVVFVMIWSYAGYSMIIYLAGLQNIPEELYEASRIDGSSDWQNFRHITLPLLQPAITLNVLLSIIGTLGAYDIIVVLTNGGPGMASTTLGLYIFKNLYLPGLSKGYLAALSILQFALILFVVVIVQYYLRRREVDQ